MGSETPLWERLLKALGFNTRRLRWKLQQRQIQRERDERRAENESRSLQYQHKICPSCKLTVDRDEKVCPRCQAPLAGMTRTRLSRHLRRIFPEGASYNYSLFFVAVNVIFFAAMILQSGGPAELNMKPTGAVMTRFGIWTVGLVARGEWWRLVTPILLHLSLLHLAFNCIALAQLGPLLEQIVGRSRFLFLYLFTGVGGFVVSVGYRLIAHQGGGGGGASGAIYGLIGAGLVLAYVRKSPGTHIFREGLLRWALWGVVISFIPGIDLAAHLGGGIFGGLAALLLAPTSQARRLPAGIWIAIEVLCLALIIGAFALTAITPH